MLKRKIKGGVTVDLMGVDAFLPGSQIALRRVPNIEDLIGEIYDFKIIKLNKRRRNIVVIARVILEEERAEEARDAGQGAPGRSGPRRGRQEHHRLRRLHRSGRYGRTAPHHRHVVGPVGHPSEVVDIAAELDVKVLDIDWDRERISLGLKQLLPYPWTDIDKKYPVGSRVRGKVVSITNYGAFVELAEGRRGSGAHLRDVVDSKRPAPVEAREHR